jgi:K+-sensing histidine kinase KdpD
VRDTSKNTGQVSYELRRLQITTDRLIRLQVITAALSQSCTTLEVAEAIIEQGLAALSASGGFVALLNKEATELEMVQVTGYPSEYFPKWERLPLSTKLPITDAINQGEALWFPSVTSLVTHYPSITQVLIEHNKDRGAWVALPLMVEGRKLGGLGLSFPGERHFNRDDQAFLLALAGLCSQALDRAQLYEFEKQARKTAEELAHRTARLQVITASLSKALTPSEVGQVVVEQGVRALEAKYGALVLLDESQTQLQIVNRVGYDQPEINNWQHFSLSLHTPHTEAVRTGKPVLVESSKEFATRYPHLIEASEALGIQALASVPLLVGDQAVGAIGISFQEPHSFNEDKVNFMLILAQQCALALERARLFEAEQEARTQAEQALNWQDRFLTTLAHELKTPITALKGFSQLLNRQLAKKTNPDLVRITQTSQAIAKNAERLSHLVMQLLTATEIEIGKLEFNPELTDLKALLENVIERVRRDGTIELQMPDEPVMGLLDPTLFTEAITGVVDNALKYGPADSKVRVELGFQGSDWICITVTDRGKGIPQEQRPKIFERFYQASDRERLGGLGLGLYLTDKIIQRHGGKVEARFPPEGGAQFEISLPYNRPTKQLSLL